MIMTEAEASKKWCPLARVIPGKMPADGNGVDIMLGAPTYNRVLLANADGPFLPVGGSCIGAKCMAWQERDSQHWLVSLDGAPAELWNWNPEASDHYKDRVVVTKNPNMQGYCGAFQR